MLLFIYCICNTKSCSNAYFKKFVTGRNIYMLVVIIYMLHPLYSQVFAKNSYLYIYAYIYALAMLCASQLALNFNPELSLFFKQNSKLEKHIRVKTKLSNWEKSLLDFYFSSEDLLFDLFHYLFKLICFFTVVMHLLQLPLTLPYFNWGSFLSTVDWLTPRMGSFYVDVYYIYVFVHLFRLILYIVVKFCCTDSIKGSDKLILLYIVVYLTLGIRWF